MQIRQHPFVTSYYRIPELAKTRDDVNKLIELLIKKKSKYNGGTTPTQGETMLKKKIEEKKTLLAQVWRQPDLKKLEESIMQVGFKCCWVLFCCILCFGASSLMVCFALKNVQIIEACLALASNPTGLKYNVDGKLGTHQHVFSILGPHTGYYYGDIILIFDHSVMYTIEKSSQHLL